MKKQLRGFTLIELMTVIALLGILLGLGVPSMRELILNNRAAAQANDLLSAFVLARSEAVKRGVNVRVCPSSNGSNCIGTSPQTNWHQGWLVFADADGNGVPAADELVQYWRGPGAGSGFALTAPSGVVVYGPTGVATGTGTFEFSHSALDTKRQIAFSATGRPSVKQVQ